ncbi:hypothetical protein L249_8644 [Ophiocordyceps polyrhachis-furcata BCC 54312]|uniref:Nuclear membrane fusion protein Kar5 n=1 Tax=Ophiocordyceps polyrhachis-furcata BCC 54312 TaxID=1330021 RepID=A0A367L6X6_9HYPO|nr:hypothetical protein L249_8644 [Ophiocordyceps polyrhachis-furcata BCC 54312]
MASRAETFSWGTSRSHSGSGQLRIDFGDSSQPIHRPSEESSDIYAVTLKELQELESEPLCHRIAARLLVNNCQLLDGQDEASVLTDSGRATRDFVDFFAASLAICDLERGSFLIPQPCSEFREPVLADLPIPSKPHLHVSPSDIDNCLRGLAGSDSAWNTWVSYRHKALRFCDAARADNEKDKNIHVFQKITKVMGGIASQMETDLGARFAALNKMVKSTAADVEGISPKLDDLRAGIIRLGQTISRDMYQGTQQTATSLQSGLKSARGLEYLLKRLLATTMEHDERMKRTHESALRVAADGISADVGTVMAILGAAVDASTSLQRELMDSQSRAAEVSKSQKKIEAGMQRLSKVASALSLEQERQSVSLERAQQSALQISDILISASASAENFKKSLVGVFGLVNWWPYLILPPMVLVVGSYGLAPSVARNLGLGAHWDFSSSGRSSTAPA